MTGSVVVRADCIPNCFATALEALREVGSGLVSCGNV